MTDKPKDPRLTAALLALAAAACLVYGAFTRHWLVNASRVEDRGVGLRSVYSCVGDKPDACVQMTTKEFVEEFRGEGTQASQQTSSAFAPMGWATFIECLIAAFGLAVAAGLALAKKTPNLPIAPTTLSLLGIMATLGTGMVFVATKPGPPGYVGVGTSFWIFAIGAVLGIAASQWLAKLNRPADPDLLADSMNPDGF